MEGRDANEQKGCIPGVRETLPGNQPTTVHVRHIRKKRNIIKHLIARDEMISREKRSQD
jgi:hypothetical protein